MLGNAQRDQRKDLLIRADFDADLPALVRAGHPAGAQPQFHRAQGKHLPADARVDDAARLAILDDHGGEALHIFKFLEQAQQRLKQGVIADAQRNAHARHGQIVRGGKQGCPLLAGGRRGKQAASLPALRGFKQACQLAAVIKSIQPPIVGHIAASPPKWRIFFYIKRKKSEAFIIYSFSGQMARRAGNEALVELRRQKKARAACCGLRLKERGWDYFFDIWAISSARFS